MLQHTASRRVSRATFFFSTAAGNMKTRRRKADRHQNAACAWEAGKDVTL